MALSVKDFLDCWNNERVDALEIAKTCILETTTKARSQNRYSKNLTGAEQAKLALSFAMSVSVIPGFATLEGSHAKQLLEVINQIRAYTDDTSKDHPLNFLLFASPGAGKSFLVECLAKKLDDVCSNVIEFNMATMSRNEDIVQAIDAARNVKILDKYPIVFLDEFDSDPNRYPMLLPLLWDGKMSVSSRDLRVGRSIFILAGSSKNLPSIVSHIRSMKPNRDDNGKEGKLVDLLSRINGGMIEIPEYYDKEAGLDRRSDKVCLAVSFIRRRFGKQLRWVSLGFLKFIATSEFRYDARSIRCILDEITFIKKAESLDWKRFENLPFASEASLLKSSLAAHIWHPRGPSGIVRNWKEAMSDHRDVLISTPFLDDVRLGEDLSPSIMNFLAADLVDYAEKH